MRINKISTIASLAAASGLCLVHSANASIVTMNLSDEETATTSISNGAATAFTQLPATALYGQAFGASTGDVPGAAGFTFYDDYEFTISGATADSVTSEINLGSLSLNSLQERVYAVNGNSPLPVVGTPSGFQTPWTAAVGFSANGETGMQTVMNPTTLAAGTYVLEIRGDVTGSDGGSYSGTLNLSPVPLPAALPLVLSGLGLLGGLYRSARGG